MSPLSIHLYWLRSQMGVDASWLVLCGALVFVMHGGFAMVSSMQGPLSMLRQMQHLSRSLHCVMG